MADENDLCWVCIRDRHTLRSMVRICCKMKEVVARRGRSSEQAHEHAPSFSEWQQLAHALSQPKPSSQHISSTQSKPKRRRRSNLTTFTHMNLHLTLHFTSLHLPTHSAGPPNLHTRSTSTRLARTPFGCRSKTRADPF